MSILLVLYRYVVAMSAALVYRMAFPDIWLFFSRPDEKDGNAYDLYRWAKDKKKCYFVIRKDSPQFEKGMVGWGSLKHYFLSAAAKVHVFDILQNGNLINRRRREIFHLKTKNVFLQHGVTRVDIPLYHYDRQRFDLCLACAHTEYSYLCHTFGYPKENVALTGFARFDDLLKNVSDKRYILIMPTWRWDLKQMNSDDFLKSEFHVRFQSLLRNRNLIEFMKRNNIGLRFYLHYMIHNRLDLFDIPSDIEIYNATDSVHDLLRDCSLLITDYSSVFFDAAYAGKPLIYYQFQDDYYNSKESYFKYEEDGFGPVVKTEEDLINTIGSLWSESVFVQLPLYSDRCNSFFAYHDTDNCQRIYDSIVELENRITN